MSSKTTRMPLSPSKIDADFSVPTHEQWKEAALAGLPDDEDFESLQHTTLDGLVMRVLYDQLPADQVPPVNPMPESISDDSNSDRDGNPDYSSDADSLNSSNTNTWDNRLAVYHTQDNTLSNQQILTGLNGGNTSVQLQMERGDTFSTLLENVRPELAGIHCLCSLEYETVAQHFATYLHSQSLDPATVSCSFNADPVGCWLVTGREPPDVDQLIEQLGRFSLNTREVLPQSQSVMVDVSVHHNAGASATQELHAAIATGTLYLQALLESGMNVQQANEQITFKLSCDADILMGVVKLRSLSALWDHLLGQLSTQQNLPATQLPPVGSIRIVAETSRRYLSSLDPWNNHIRNIAACSAAAMGNTQSIIVHPHDRIDERLLTDDATIGERMARNLPIVLSRESGLTFVTDPMSGSYAVENLTQQLTELTWQSLSDMGEAHTWLQEIRSGSWQTAVAATHAQRVKLLQDQRNIVVGVNRYAASDKTESTAQTEIVKSARDERLAVSGRLEPVRDATGFEVADSAEGTRA